MRRAILAGSMLAIMIAMPTLAKGLVLTVDHPDGTTLNPDEVVYTVTSERGGFGGRHDYVLWHRCYDDGTLILDVSKRLWFSGNGAKDYGDATFHTTGDSCSGTRLR